MTLLAGNTHIRSHRRIPREWHETEHARPITDSDIRRARHRAENLTQDTRTMSRMSGWVPDWEKVVGKKTEVLPPSGVTPIFIPAHRTRWQKFRDRANAVIDWFVLSAMGVFFASVLAAGGILAAKGLIILFQELIANGNV